jgi:hypothetical protein
VSQSALCAQRREGLRFAFKAKPAFVVREQRCRKNFDGDVR